jgi:hypothetical protein
MLRAPSTSPTPTTTASPARDAWFLSPTAIAFNRAGGLYLAEGGACLIRKISIAGDLTTFAGTGTCAEAPIMQPATGPDLPIPATLAADSRGRVYMLDTSGNSYVISADGKSGPTGFPPTLGNGRLAIDAKDRIYLFSFIQGLRISPDGRRLSLAVGANGDAWLANGALAVLNSRGQFPIGIQEGGDAGDGGPAQLARVHTAAVAFAPNGDLYLLDNNRVRRLTGVARAKAPPGAAAISPAHARPCPPRQRRGHSRVCSVRNHGYLTGPPSTSSDFGGALCPKE